MVVGSAREAHETIGVWRQAADSLGMKEYSGKLKIIPKLATPDRAAGIHHGVGHPSQFEHLSAKAGTTLSKAFSKFAIRGALFQKTHGAKNTSSRDGPMSFTWNPGLIPL